ncbi:14981_t:CDS:2, partial [Funneliformis caledonium]
MSNSFDSITTSNKQELDFFINNRPTPVAFFRKFEYTSKTTGLSNWCSALNASLACCKDDPKLVELKQNYENDHYKKSINDYFRLTYVEKEKVSIDKTITKRTGKAIRNRVDDLLPNDQALSKKPRLTKSHEDGNSTLMSAESKINQEDHSSCSASSDPSSNFNREEGPEHFNAESLKKERYRIGYSWENIVDNIDFRNISRNDWVFEGYNLSLEFRKFQRLTITQVKKDPILCFQNDLQKILCLSNIMLIERIKPPYITCTQAIWDRICQKKLLPRLPSVAYEVVHDYSSMLNSFMPLDNIQDTWGINFSKAVELNNHEEKNKFFQIQIILRNFLLLSSKDATINNEDTF